MRTRTREEVGALLRERRQTLGLRQEGIDGVSSSTVRLIEKGDQRVATPRGLTVAAMMRALGWPPDAIVRLAAGEDPASLTGTTDRLIEMSASGVDLDELRRVDPETYAAIETLARSALDRANERQVGQ